MPWTQPRTSSSLEVKGYHHDVDELTIGELSARSGVATSALRFYEAEGLIASRRTDGNQRRYARPTLRRVALIQAGRTAGISLERIRVALDELPPGRTASKRDWERLSRAWRAGRRRADRAARGAARPAHLVHRLRLPLAALVRALQPARPRGGEGRGGALPARRRAGRRPTSGGHGCTLPGDERSARSTTEHSGQTEADSIDACGDRPLPRRWAPPAARDRTRARARRPRRRGRPQPAGRRAGRGRAGGLLGRRRGRRGGSASRGRRRADGRIRARGAGRRRRRRAARPAVDRQRRGAPHDEQAGDAQRARARRRARNRGSRRCATSETHATLSPRSARPRC